MGKPSKSNRRDFLKGKSAGKAIEDVVDAFHGGTNHDGSEFPLPEIMPATYLLRFSKQAMACEFEVLLNAGQYPQANRAALNALNLVEELEQQLSVYQEESEISLVNFLAGKKPIAIEENLFELIEQCLQLHRETHGAFDVTAGPLSKVWGFFRRQGQIPSDEDLQQAFQFVGSEAIELDAENQTVHFKKPNMEINFGAIGKGYALDKCAEILNAATLEHYLLHGGHSSMLAVGSRATGESEKPPGWEVRLGHPLRRDKRFASIFLHNKGLGTSGAGTQFFRHQGKRYGHILDPRTGHPAEQILSVTVTHPSAAVADALSTAFYVLGVEESMNYCQLNPQAAALFTLKNQNSTKVKVESIGFTENELVIYKEPILG